MSEENTLSTSSAGPLGEISQAPPAFEAFLDRHQLKIVALAILLAIAAVVYVVYGGIKKSGEETAGAMLVKATDASDLKSIVKNHEGTLAAYSAKVLLAEKQWEDGNQDESIATLKMFVESDRGHPARPSAEASLAAKLWSQGKTDDAVGYFKALTQDTDSRYLAPYAWISLGDIHTAKGETEAAEKAYTTVEREFSDSTFSQEAIQRRLLLKATPPVEITAPISVPEVKLTDDADAPPVSKDTEVKDLIDVIQQGSSGTAPAFPGILPDSSTDPE